MTILPSLARRMAWVTVVSEAVAVPLVPTGVSRVVVMLKGAAAELCGAAMSRGPATVVLRLDRMGEYSVRRVICWQ